MYTVNKKKTLREIQTFACVRSYLKMFYNVALTYMYIIIHVRGRSKKQCEHIYNFVMDAEPTLKFDQLISVSITPFRQYHFRIGASYFAVR